MTSLTFATYLAPIMQPVYQWITDRVGTTLDCETRLVVGSSYAELTKGEIDVAFLCGWPYVRMADDPTSSVELLAAPVLAGSEHGRGADYCSRVIVRADSPYRSFADLRGCSWSFNESASYSGYLATLDHLRLAGTGREFFARMVEAGWHEESIRLVRSGEIDASAIDCQVLDVAISQDRSLASAVRVLSSFRAAPIQPVVVRGQVPERVRSAVRQALLEAASDSEGKRRLAAGHVERFVRVSDRSYNVIRERARAAAAAGLL